MTHPVLYSFRRCPYAMRARLALQLAGRSVELREVILKDKPQQLRELSPKATVPVLQLSDGKVLEESLDIMLWALADQPIWQRLDPAQQHSSLAWIKHNDDEFKQALDRYKYSDRYPQDSQATYRAQGEQFLAALEQQLTASAGLIIDELTLADYAILPFIRQFALVDKSGFDQSPYPAVQRWLADFLDSADFQSVMLKYPQWQPGDPAIYFPVKPTLPVMPTAMEASQTTLKPS